MLMHHPRVQQGRNDDDDAILLGTRLEFPLHSGHPLLQMGAEEHRAFPSGRPAADRELQDLKQRKVDRTIPEKSPLF